MDSYRIVELDVIRWSEARGILPNSTPQAQLIKMVSEVGELADAIGKKNREATIDGLGDVWVCMVNIAALLDLDLVECFNHAYNEIKDRKGYMNKEGIFIKQ